MRPTFAFALVAVAAAGCTVQGKTECQPTGPSPRAFATAVLDTNSNEVYLYGGENGGSQPLDELWRYTFTGCVGWLELTPDTTTTPGGMSRYAATFDPSRDRIVYVGGSHDDVWSLDIPTLKWTKVLTAGSPPPQALDNWAVYDTNNMNDRAIVGGVGVKPLDFNDTSDASWGDYFDSALDGSMMGWTPPSGGVGALDLSRTAIFDWNGAKMGNWSILGDGGRDVAFSGDMPAGSIETMAWDPQQKRLVAFAGDGAYGLEDVDANGTVATIRHLAVASQPPTRSGAAFTISGEIGFLFGGADVNGCYLNDWWYLTDEATWTQRGMATGCP